MSMGQGAAEGLEKVLARMFLEAQLKQRQKEHTDELGLKSRGLDIQEQENVETAGLRKAQLDALTHDRQERAVDRDENRKIQEETKLHGRLGLMPKGTPIDSPDMIVGMAKHGLGGMLRPVPNEPRFEFSGTQAQANADAANEDRDAAGQRQERHYMAMEDAANRRIEQAGQKPSITPTAESNIINRLSNQWTKAMAPLAELHRQADLMERGLEAARRGDLAQGAQAVLVTFQKVLDPPSVVREGEYRRGGEGMSLVNRAKGQLEQWIKGGAGVPLSELEKFANLARAAVASQSKGHSVAVKERIGKTADHYNIPRDLIFEDYDFSTGQGAGPAGPPAPTAQQPTTETDKQRMDRLKKMAGG